MLEWIGYLATALAVTGVVLCNRMDRRCHLIWVASNLISMTLHVLAGIHSLAARDIIFTILAVYGYRRWSSKKGNQMFDRTDRALWWDAALRVNSGCTKVSPGCKFCWAESELKMRCKNKNAKIAAQWAGDFSGDVRLLPDNIERILKAKTPRAWAVWNDLFHELVPFDYVDQVLAAFAICPEQLGIVLTKRPDRMAEHLNFLTGEAEPGPGAYPIQDHFSDVILDSKYYMEKAAALEKEDLKWQHPDGRDTPNYDDFYNETIKKIKAIEWPLPNIWLGTSAEDQERLEERVGYLLRCQASLLFLSLEPLLGPMSVRPYLERVDAMDCPVAKSPHGICRRRRYDGKCLHDNRKCDLSVNRNTGVNWVIVGGESKGGAAGRPCNIEWVRKIVYQCKAAGVPVFVKQLHIDGKLVKDIEKFPEDLRLREVPEFKV